MAHWQWSDVTVFVGASASKYFQLLGFTFLQSVQPFIETTDNADESLMECSTVLPGVSPLECDWVSVLVFQRHCSLWHIRNYTLRDSVEFHKTWVCSGSAVRTTDTVHFINIGQ